MAPSATFTAPQAPPVVAPPTATVDADIPLPAGSAVQQAPQSLSDYAGMPGQTPLEFFYVGRTGNGNGKYYIFKPRKRVAGRDALLANSVNVHMDLFGGVEPQAGQVIFRMSLA